MFGRQARTFLVPAAQTSSLRSLALGTAHISNDYNRIQMRLSSSTITALTPPWQFKNLSKIERKSFERWGPNYFEHLTDAQKELVQRVVEKRKSLTAQFEKEFGSDWYAIMEEANAIKDEQEKIDKKEQVTDAKEFRQGDAKTRKAMRMEFYEGLAATKADRLHKVMQEVFKKRRNL